MSFDTILVVASFTAVGLMTLVMLASWLDRRLP
jgi:hypothetical protein